MTRRSALSFVKRHGIVLESARGPVPNLAEAVVGGRIRGSWWGHAKGKQIFWLTRAVRDSADVLVCRLVSGKDDQVFMTSEEAQEQGLSPCRVCTPDVLVH